MLLPPQRCQFFVAALRDDANRIVNYVGVQVRSPFSTVGFVHMYQSHWVSRARGLRWTLQCPVGKPPLDDPDYPNWLKSQEGV